MEMDHYAFEWADLINNWVTFTIGIFFKQLYYQ